MNRRVIAYRLGLAAILMAAALMRLPGLDRVPPPLNQDEASRGYDAWSILETGADRHGRAWPLFLESFGPGDYTAALSTYLTIPVVALLGPTVTAMRLPDALLGVLTVALVFGWSRRQFNPVVGLAAAAALALDPWHIALSRTAHESGFAPFLLAAALWGLGRAGLWGSGNETDAPQRADSDRMNAAWAFLAGVMFALHAWVYPATRLFTPLFLAATAIAFRREWGIRRSQDESAAEHRRLRWRAYACAIGLLVGSSPIWVTALSHPRELAARAASTVVFFNGSSPIDMARQILRNSAANLDPRYLFFQADEMSGQTIPRVGQHLMAVAPLILIGLGRVIAAVRSSPSSRWLLAWLLLYPIPAAICDDWNPHPMRTVGGMLLFPILTGLGVEWLVERIRINRDRPPAGRSLVPVIATVLLGVAVTANVELFAKIYYGQFPKHAETGYQTALWRALSFAVNDRDAGFVLVTNRAVQPYIYALLLDAGGPARRPPLVASEGPKGFHQVLRLGRIFFAPPQTAAFPEAASGWIRDWATIREGTPGLVIERADQPAPGDIVAEFDCGDGENPGENYVVRRWTKK